MSATTQPAIERQRREVEASLARLASESEHLARLIASLGGEETQRAAFALRRNAHTIDTTRRAIQTTRTRIGGGVA